VPQKPRKTHGFVNPAAHSRHTDLKGQRNRSSRSSRSGFVCRPSFVCVDGNHHHQHSLILQTELGQTFVRWSLVGLKLQDDFRFPSCWVVVPCSQHVCLESSRTAEPGQRECLQIWERNMLGAGKTSHPGLYALGLQCLRWNHYRNRSPACCGLDRPGAPGNACQRSLIRRTTRPPVTVRSAL
jgi:hypothetical protein